MGMQITVKRLSGSIGAEVRGVSLNRPLDDVTFANHPWSEQRDRCTVDGHPPGPTFHRGYVARLDVEPHQCLTRAFRHGLTP